MGNNGNRRKMIKQWGVKIDLIYSYFPPSLWNEGTILDVGSGTGGQGLRNWIAMGVPASNCTAIDALEERLLPLKKLGCNCVALDLEDENISNRVEETFDIIICSHLLEHITQECEDRLLKDFVKMGSNIAICYPKKPEITKAGKRIKYMHRRRPHAVPIVELFKSHFEEVTCEEVNFQMFIMAKGKKSE